MAMTCFVGFTVPINKTFIIIQPCSITAALSSVKSGLKHACNKIYAVFLKQASASIHVSIALTSCESELFLTMPLLYFSRRLIAFCQSTCWPRCSMLFFWHAIFPQILLLQLYVTQVPGCLCELYWSAVVVMSLNKGCRMFLTTTFHFFEIILRSEWVWSFHKTFFFWQPFVFFLVWTYRLTTTINMLW